MIDRNTDAEITKQISTKLISNSKLIEMKKIGKIKHNCVIN